MELEKMSNRLENQKPPLEMKSLMRRQPQQDRSLKRVDTILDTTAELIVELGIENVNAGLIARKSGIPVGTIYQFFTDMEAISTEIIIRNKKRVDAVIMDRIEAHTITKDYQKGVDEIMTLMIEGVKAEPGLTSIMQALLHTKPYVESTQITINRLSEYSAAIFKSVGAKMDEEKCYLVANVMFRAAYPLYEKILFEDDQEIADLYQAELATLCKQYLSAYLEDLDEV